MTDVIARLSTEGLLGAGAPIGNYGRTLDYKLSTLGALTKEARQEIIPPPTVGSFAPPLGPIATSFVPSLAPALASKPAPANPTIDRLATAGLLGSGLPIGNMGRALNSAFPTLGALVSEVKEAVIQNPSISAAPVPAPGLTLPMNLAAGLPATVATAPSIAPTTVAAPVRSIGLPIMTQARLTAIQTGTGLLRIPMLESLGASTQPVSAPGLVPKVDTAIPLQTTQIQLTNALDRIELGKLKVGKRRDSYKTTELNNLIMSLGLPKPKGNMKKADLVNIIANYLRQVAPERMINFNPN